MINKLDAVQRRAARFVLYDYSQYSSVSAMLSHLGGWPLLSQRRENIKAII